MAETTTEAPVIPAAATAAPTTDTAISTTATSEPPVVESAPAATVTEAPAAEPVKTDAPDTTAVESVLGDTKPAEVKTEAVATEKKDTIKTEAAKPADVKAETAAEVKVDLPVYEPFKFPENINLDKEPLDAFTKILGEIETGKLDHLGMQEKGQALIDLATKATTDSINRLNDSYVEIHNQAKRSRLTTLKSDPDMGGDKFGDTVTELQRSITEYGGTPAQIAEFRKEVVDAGLDASPAVCRLIYNMQQKINQYTTEGDEQRMVPGGRPAPSKVKDYQRFYTGGN